MIRRGLGIGKGKGYYNLATYDPYIHSLSARSIKSKCPYPKRNLNTPTVQIISPKKFDTKFKNDYADYEIGYATTKIYPNNDVKIFVKDSGDYERNGLLLMHELKEIEIWKDLVNNKCENPTIADEMAHNMNPVKVEGVMDTYQLNSLNAKGKKKKNKDKKRRNAIGRGLGTALGLVAGAEATKGTQYEGVGALVGGYAGYKIGESLSAKGKTMSAREIFNKAFPGGDKNFMTPRVLKIVKAGKNRAVELSTGTGLFDQQIYGVTVVDVDESGNTVRRHDLSKSFQHRSEAEMYINNLDVTI